MPRKDPDAYRAYMREYMKKRSSALIAERSELRAEHRASMVVVGKAHAVSGREIIDERGVPDTREYRLNLPASSPYWE